MRMEMGTISAKKITNALVKARDVGIVEESLTIDNVTLVLRNLRPDQYVAVYEENKEREGIEHLYSFQVSHLCRAVVEINGIDFREVDFVEVEEEVKDPKSGELVLEANGSPKIKTIKLERHEYVRKFVLSHWLKEPLQIAWRKFADILKLAEDKAKEGVKFVLPEMTAEERFREAVSEVQESMGDVPPALVESILEEAGFVLISTAQEIKKAFEKTDALAREVGATAPKPEDASPMPVAQPEQQAASQPQSPPVQVSPAQESPPPAPPPAPGPRVRPATPEEIMARRTPLNREAVGVPSPVAHPTIASPQTVSQGPVQATGEEVVRVSKRAQEIAKLEAEGVDMDPPLAPPGDPTMTPRHITPGAAAGPGLPNAPHLQRGVPPEVAVLSQKGKETVDMEAFGKIVNKPPAGGLNPRFRPVR
jgi:hypothetical protein